MSVGPQDVANRFSRAMPQFRMLLPVFTLALAVGAVAAHADDEAAGADPPAEIAEAEVPAAGAPLEIEIPPPGSVPEEETTDADDELDVELTEPLGGGSLLDEAPQSDPNNPGQAALDQALERKLSAEDLKDLNDVVDLLDEALEDGLDADNTDFAEQVLVATLMQRAQSLSAALLRQPVADPQRDPRWLQVRQFALTDLMRAVSLDESQIDAWMLIGRMQSLPRGSKSEARRAFSKAIRLADAAIDDPTVATPKPELIAQAYALRGAAQKEDEDQVADFTKAIKLAPEKVEYRLLRARAHQAAKRSEECLADIDVALEMAPDNPKVHELKALALLTQERLDDALESFDRASELEPKLLTPYQYRGELYNKLGQLDEAIAQLDKAVELQPNYIPSLLMRAQLLASNDQFEKALTDIDAVLRQQPGMMQAHLMKVQALVRLERTDDAIAWLRRLVNAAPNQPQLQLQLGLLYVDKEMQAEAIEAFSAVLDLDEANELALRMRGDMYLYVGKHAEALADFDRALEIEPDESGVLNNYAWTLATSPFDDLRDGERAVELATKACQVTEYGMPHILSTLAASYAEAGDFDEAIRWSQQAITKAEQLGQLEGYDGQLEAELNSYRAGQPWRELQQLGVSGRADEAADELAEEGVVAPEETPAEELPAEAEDEPAVRSFDF